MLRARVLPAYSMEGPLNIPSPCTVGPSPSSISSSPLRRWDLREVPPSQDSGFLHPPSRSAGSDLHLRWGTITWPICQMSGSQLRTSVSRVLRSKLKAAACFYPEGWLRERGLVQSHTAKSLRSVSQVRLGLPLEPAPQF